MLATTRNHERARLYYERIADQARKDGRPDVAALAELRMTLRHLPPYMREARVTKIAYSTDPHTTAAQLEARLALARIAYEQKRPGKGDSIVRGLSQFDIKKPILVYAPPWELSSGSDAGDGSVDQVGSPDGGVPATIADDGGRGGLGTPSAFPAAGGGAGAAFTTARMALNVKDMWIDVGFHITPDGRVSDVQVLRKHGDIGWTKPLLASIGGRRYTPAVPGSPEASRRERYTYTSGLEPGTGTKLAQHSPAPRVEYFDLSDISAAN